MQTLLDAYIGLGHDKWDYYHEHRNEANISNPFVLANNAAGHHRFIRNYFKHSGKEMALEQFAGYQKMTDSRAIHTNSVFFLGVLIRGNTMLRSSLFDERRSKIGYPVFPFVWFLSTLFHDFGMQLEESLNEFQDMETLSGLFQHFNVEHSLLEHLPVKGDQDLFRMIEPYYLYRIGNQRIDHGIMAGIYLYDRLVKIRREKKRFNDSKLSWHHSLEKQYAAAAAAMACHNIFTVPINEPVADIYRNYSLDYLIQPSFREITAQSYPLLFLFGLVDTIDPIKLYMRRGMEPAEILTGLEIGFSRNSVKFGATQGSSIDLIPLAEKIESLRGWLAVRYDYSRGLITIKFA